MKQRILFLISLFLTFTVLMLVQKPIFMLVQPEYTTTDMGSVWSVMWHGLPMDMSMAGYLCVLPAILLVVSVWCQRPFMKRLLRGYLIFAAILMAVAATVDTMLFPYWQFRLETTPLFYLTTSPAASMASILWWQYIVAVIALCTLSYLFYRALTANLLWRPLTGITKKRGLATVVCVLMTAALFIPIRGGVTVSTMAPGRVFFSTDMRLNQAALNPLFNFMHSATHNNRLDKQFRYYTDTEAQAIEKGFLTLPADSCNFDSTVQAISLSNQRPDIWLIILESFSSALMPSMGGEAIATSLDSIAATSVLFTNFYAESFRTDRALATILSGQPAMPTASALKYPDKFGAMPSLSAILTGQGYATNYYYGGDANFTNMRGYLVTTGFHHIISDVDFPLSKRLSKWGALDGEVFNAALQPWLALPQQGTTPTFNVVQTSSSHEPFDVPGRHRHADPAANAFIYADSCLGAFVNGLRQSPRWNNTLVVIVPDHYGAYPALTDARARHHIPLVLTGGALQGAPARIATVGSQSAIAPTVLALMGLEYDAFPAPRNLLDAAASGHYAWFTDRDSYGLILPGSQHAIVRADDGVTISGDTLTARRARAHIQTIYRNFNALH